MRTAQKLWRDFDPKDGREGTPYEVWLRVSEFLSDRGMDDVPCDELRLRCRYCDSNVLEYDLGNGDVLRVVFDEDYAPDGGDHTKVESVTLIGGAL